MKTSKICTVALLCVFFSIADGRAVAHGPSDAKRASAPKGLRGEHKLPDRYPYVVQDILRYCRPRKGFWVDLGAGKGQVAIPLIEASGNAVVMLDPNSESMSKGLEIAREKGLGNRLSAVVGVAEKMPFPDNSVDLLVRSWLDFLLGRPGQGLTRGISRIATRREGLCGRRSRQRISEMGHGKTDRPQERASPRRRGRQVEAIYRTASTRTNAKVGRRGRVARIHHHG